MKKNLHLARDYRRRCNKKLIRRITRKERQKKRVNTNEWYVIKLFQNINIMIPRPRRALSQFLDEIKQAILNQENKIYLDFSNVSKASAQGMLFLWAEIFRIKNLFPEIRINGSLPLNRKCQHVFKQVGMSKLLGVSSKLISQYKDVVTWRAVSGSTVDGKIYAEQLMRPYLSMMDEKVSSALWLGVSEAMTNVKHHAHKLPRKDKISRSDELPHWWMFSQERDGYLTVLICDLGVGIPVTIPLSDKSILKPVQRWMKIGKRTDADVLSAVLKKTVLAEKPELDEAISSTNQSHRGRGFYNIVKTVRDVNGGEVSVLSNHGAWESDYNKQQSKLNFKQSINGTIISWRVPINRGKNDNSND